MPYNNNIPLATDVISASQQQLLDNFAALQQLFELNHVNFNQAAQGKHKWLTMPSQVAAPATLAGEIALFSRTSAYTTQPELCVRKENNGAVIEMTSSLGANPGWAFNSSGILFKWGSLTALAVDYPVGTTVAFPVAATIPVFGTVLNALVTTASGPGVSTDTMATLRNVTVADITVMGSQRTANVGSDVNFRYLVMGIL